MRMMHARVAVFGAPGYSGAELVKLLALQTQIQASMQTTALLSKLTLVNFMS